MKPIAYLNGKYIEQAHAKVSVFDRGFLFGDSVYEVIPIYNAQPFRFADHIKRLQASLAAIEINLDLDLAQWQTLAHQVIERNQGGNLSLYIQVTRGIENKREHVAAPDTQPTILITASALSPSIAKLAPIAVTLLEDIRWLNCHIKTTALLGNIMLKQQASKLGYDEAILHRGEQITEGTTTNIFLVKNNIIYTPKKSHCILAGITRDVIIELAEKASITVCQEDVSIEQLWSADEIWLSSSSREISPVTRSMIK